MAQRVQLVDVNGNALTSNANGQALSINSTSVVGASDWVGNVNLKNVNGATIQMASGDGETPANLIALALYAMSAGGPVDSSGKAGGLSLDRLKTLQGSGVATASITSTLASDQSIACSAGVLKTMIPGQKIKLSGATTEWAYVAETYVISSTATSVPLKAPLVQAGNTTVTWDQFIANGPGTSNLQPNGVLPVASMFLDTSTSNYYLMRAAGADGQTAAQVQAAAQMLYNGSTEDRARGNLDNISLVASAAYTTTQTSADQTNYNARGVIVVLDMTVAGASPSVTLEIDMKDPVSGKYVSLLTGAAVTTVSTNIYTVYPGAPATANVSANSPLPRTWRVKVTANNANSGTYSVGTSLIV